mmetsp:Transcript_1743/g.4520  ORF Transcript_1743/g.4520 Transcript_1743/m.4520 type:complete len:283 (+) Transcript_1743:358-1206(+)
MLPSGKISSTSSSSPTKSAPVKMSLSKAGEKPESIWTFGSCATAGKPYVSPRRFQKIILGAAYGSPHTKRPACSKRRRSRRRCVSQKGWPSCRREASMLWSNCMSEKTIRSGSSSGFNLCEAATSRIRSHAASRFVDPPQGALTVFCTFSKIELQSLKSTQLGFDSKVRMRLQNAGAASSVVRSPRPTAAKIGKPIMEPDTSTNGTSLPSSMPRGRADRSSSMFASAPCASAASATLASCPAAASARACLTPAFMDSHWASSRSNSMTDGAEPTFKSSRTIS